MRSLAAALVAFGAVTAGLALNLFSYGCLEREPDSELRGLSARIGERFAAEVRSAGRTLELVSQRRLADRNHLRENGRRGGVNLFAQWRPSDPGCPEDAPSFVEILDEGCQPPAREELSTPPDRFRLNGMRAADPYLDMLVWTTPRGEQTITWTTKRMTTPLISVRQHLWFQDLAASPARVDSVELVRRRPAAARGHRGGQRRALRGRPPRPPASSLRPPSRVGLALVVGGLSRQGDTAHALRLRGVIRGMPAMRLMKESVRRFVRDEIADDRVRALESAERSGRNTARGIIVILVMGGGLMLYLTEPEGIAKIAGLATTLAGAATQLTTWLGANLHWRRSGAKGG